MILIWIWVQNRGEYGPKNEIEVNIEYWINYIRETTKWILKINKLFIFIYMVRYEWDG